MKIITYVNFMRLIIRSFYFILNKTGFTIFIHIIWYFLELCHRNTMPYSTPLTDLLSKQNRKTKSTDVFKAWNNSEKKAI